MKLTYHDVWKAAEEARALRASAMPTEQDAIRAMWGAYQRLKELGWNDAMYCPKDGTVFRSVHPASTGVHDASYEGRWPDGSFWVYEAGDIWPANPVLFKAKDPS